MVLAPAFLVSARRSALGRVGGLHRGRRISDLAAPIIRGCLKDARLDADDVDEVIVGNATEVGNVARLVALAAGLRETCPAYTIDRQSASGLDAVLAAIRQIGTGEARAVVAGGVESVSTAPWRVARPSASHIVPRFVSSTLIDDATVEAFESLARRFGISRMRQDAVALHSFMRAEAARTGKRFVGEILPIRANVDEARDESAGEPTLDDLEQAEAFAPGGTLTARNTGAPHDGAAFILVVSEGVWKRLGQPPALRAIAGGVRGVEPDDDALAAALALGDVLQRSGKELAQRLERIEIGERAVLEALALAHHLSIDEAIVNPDGGAVARGHPLGAAGALSVVSLFHGLLRVATGAVKLGAVASGASSGLGVAALFETINP